MVINSPTPLPIAYAMARDLALGRNIKDAIPRETIMRLTIIFTSASLSIFSSALLKDSPNSINPSKMKVSAIMGRMSLVASILVKIGTMNMIVSVLSSSSDIFMKKAVERYCSLISGFFDPSLVMIGLRPRSEKKENKAEIVMA